MRRYDPISSGPMVQVVHPGKHKSLVYEERIILVHASMLAE
jgi:hypothetical protein